MTSQRKKSEEPPKMGAQQHAIWVEDDTPPSTPATQVQEQQEFSTPKPDNLARNLCLQSVLNLFPDICEEYLQKTSEDKGHEHTAVIAHILDSIDNGEDYPRRARKRKRSDIVDGDTADDEVTIATKKFNNPDRQIEHFDLTRIKLTKTLLVQNFPRVPCKELYSLLENNRYLLFPTCLAIGKIVDDWREEDPSFRYKVRPTKEMVAYCMDNLPRAIETATTTMERELLEEFRAAKIVLQAQRQQKAAEKQREQEEEDNFERAKLAGEVLECGCCFVDKPKNRMVHCDGTESGGDRHWFCRDCARRAAGTEIGQSKYELACLSMDGCEGGFSNDQREMYLDEGMKTALERIEQEALLRMAGIENLATCPFCPYAAEYPPIEENKEFRCERPDCSLVSCRLCRKETHIPKTCAEAERENGSTARRAIEEAMTAALIRTCNKCGTPFIKQDGCNKMTCTRAGCRNVQCYVCHKSCDYAHFDDSSRGGRQGNCPLFENVEHRHEREVRQAEERARQEAVEANPGVDVDMLKINVSERVKQDEEQRKARGPRHMVHVPMPQRAQHLGQAVGPGMARRVNEPPAGIGIDPMQLIRHDVLPLAPHVGGPEPRQPAYAGNNAVVREIALLPPQHIQSPAENRALQFAVELANDKPPKREGPGAFADPRQLAGQGPVEAAYQSLQQAVAAHGARMEQRAREREGRNEFLAAYVQQHRENQQRAQGASQLERRLLRARIQVQMASNDVARRDSTLRRKQASLMLLRASHSPDSPKVEQAALEVEESRTLLRAAQAEHERAKQEHDEAARELTPAQEPPPAGGAMAAGRERARVHMRRVPPRNMPVVPMPLGALGRIDQNAPDGQGR